MLTSANHPISMTTSQLGLYFNTVTWLLRGRVEYSPACRPRAWASAAYECHHLSATTLRPLKPFPGMVAPPKPTLTLASSLTFHTKDSAL